MIKIQDKRKYILALTLFFNIGFLLLLMTTCTSPVITSNQSYPISKDDRVWMKEFFREFLLWNPGAYTLYGSKPVTTICLNPPRALTQEEIQEIKKRFPDAIEYSSHMYENYKKWQAIEGKFNIRKYLFGVFPNHFYCEDEILFFVNIEKTLETLIEYYDDFRRVLGFDFDPFLAVFEVQNRESTFWNGVLRNHQLFGILMGFGEMDSWFFTWNCREDNQKSEMKKFLASLPYECSDDEVISDPTPDHFNLPIFRTFGLICSQSIVEKYKREREQIKSLYRNRDEVDVALEWLTR